MVVFERQIYFAQMEWGDKRNKQWFKIAQPTICLIKFTTLTVFRYFKVPKVKSVFSSSIVKATGALD